MPQQKISQQTYATSPLGKMLDKLLLKIETLKPHKLKGTESAEKKQAIELLTIFEGIIHKLHRDFFPNFDEKKVMNLMSLALTLKELDKIEKKVRKKLFTRTYVIGLKIKEILPQIVEAAGKKSKNPAEILRIILNSLDKHRDDLFKGLDDVRGKPPADILEQIKQIFRDSKETKALPLMKALDDQLLKYPKEIISFVITDPITFEFTELLVTLIQEFPDNLKDLVPFLTPLAFEVDFHSGLVGTIVEGVAGASYIIQSKRDSITKEPTFDYDLTTYIGKDSLSEEVPGKERYDEYREAYFLLLLEKMNEYFLSATQSPYIKNKQIRYELLQGFTQLESEEIIETTKESLDHNGYEADINDLDALSALSNLGETIKKNKLLVQEHEALIKNLEDKQKIYATKTIRDLLKKHPELRAISDLYTEQDIDNDKLPTYAIGWPKDSQKIAVTPIHHALQQLLNRQIKLLQDKKTSLLEKIQQQSANYQVLLSPWQQEQIAAHTINIHNHSLIFKTFEDSFTELTKELSLEEKDCTEPTIILARKKELLTKLAALHVKLTQEKEQSKENLVLSTEIISLDLDKKIQKYTTEQNQVLLGKFANLIQLINTTIQTQEQKILKLEAEIEKEESEAVFSESIKTIDPETIKSQLADLEIKLTTKQEQQPAIFTELEQSANSIDQKEEQISQLKSELTQTRASLLEIDKQGIDTLNLFEQTYQPISPFPDKETLIHDQSQIQKLITMLMANSARYECNQVSLTVLDEVSKLMDQSPKEIPFKEIERLPIFKQIKQHSIYEPFKLQKKFSGFSFFLATIGLGTEAEIKSWKHYRDRQDDLFKIKPTSKEYSAQSNLLKRQIEITTTNLREKIAASRVVLPSIQEQLEQQFLEKNRLIEQIALLENKLLAETEELADLIQEKDKKLLSLRHANKDKRILEHHHFVLKTTLSLSADIYAYQQLLEDFSKKNKLTFLDKTLYTKLIDLQNKYINLIKSIDSLAMVVAEAGNPESSQQYIESLYKLGKATHQKLITTIKISLDLKPLEERLAAQQLALTKISSLDTDSVHVSEFIGHYKVLSASIVKQKGLIIDLKAKIAKINEPHTSQRFARLEQAHNQIEQHLVKSEELLLDTLIIILNDIKTKSVIIEEDFPLEQFNHFFTEFPANSALDELFSESLSPKVNDIKNLREEVSAQLKRRETVIGLFKKLHDLKPSPDNGKTEIFINKIKAHLVDYISLGNSTPILDYIDASINQFFDVELLSCLNTLSADLLDLDQEVSTTYKEITDENSQLYLNKANNILKFHAKKTPDYAAAMKQLYKLVDDMAKEWQETIPLTKKLRKNLNLFVLAHPQTLPTQAEFNQFKKHFAARLHSQDDLMGPNNSTWKIYVANFVIGLLTLGVALGLKLIYSKAYEGEYTLFFASPQKQNKVANIDDTLNKNVIPPEATSPSI